MKKINNCKICNRETTNKKFCSNTCKYSDTTIYAKVAINDGNKVLVCKICSWESKDINNNSGNPKKHLKCSHGIVTENLNYIDYYTLADKILNDNIEYLNCPECDWKTIDADNKSGAFTSHIKTHNYNSYIDFTEKHPEFKYLWERLLTLYTRSKLDYIECGICRAKLEKLSNSHLRQKHKMTMPEYKKLFPLSQTINKRIKKRASEVSILTNATREYSYISKPEQEIVEFVRSYDIQVIQSHKKFGVELDIVLPEYNLAIEYDGLRYHSEIFGKKSKLYHLNETQICEQNGYKLIHIFEDEYIHNKQIVQNKILAKCKKQLINVYARNLSVKNIEYHICKQFLIEHHIQGSTPGFSYYGLYNSDELVAVASFSKLRKSLGQTSSDVCVGLLRYATKSNYNIVGGMMKLIKQFKRDYPQYLKLISYADKRWSSKLGTIYEKVGFNLIQDGEPNYWYVHGNQRFHRFNFTKSRLVTNGGDINLTEKQIMLNSGYDIIWDCGVLKYELSI